MSRFAIALVAALGASSLLFAACGGDSSSSTPSAGNTEPASGNTTAAATKPATQGAQTGAGPDACSLLTKSEATAAAGKATKDGEPGTSVNTGSGATKVQLSICRFKDDAGANLVQVDWTKTPSAQANFDSLRKLAGNAADDVPGVGDKAYYASFAVNILKGDSIVVISLTSPAAKPGSDAVIALAKAAAARIK